MNELILQQWLCLSPQQKERLPLLLKELALTLIELIEVIEKEQNNVRGIHSNCLGHDSSL